MSSSTFLTGRMDHAAAALAFFNFKFETVQRANFLRSRLVDRLVDGRKNARSFIRSPMIYERLLLQLFRQIANDDRRFDDDDLRISRQRKFRSAGIFGSRYPLRATDCQACWDLREHSVRENRREYRHGDY